MVKVFGADAPQEDPDKDGQAYVLDMRFPGQRYDRYTGLFQNWYRDYDPASGRYVQSDPIGLNGGNATYAYVGNNPLMRVDPRGLRWLSESDSSLGFLESVLASDAIFIMNYRDMRKANTIDADKYFHCKANCESSKLGWGGVIESTIVSEVREYTDEHIKGDPRSACDEDRAANALGRNGARDRPSESCSSICSPLRPRGLEEKY